MKKETDAEEMAPEYDFSKGTRGRYAGRFFPTGPWQVGERVVLEHDVPEERLEKGDVGEVVHRYEGGGAFRVRFDSGSDDPAAVLKLSASDLRSLGAGEVLRVRSRD